MRSCVTLSPARPRSSRGSTRCLGHRSFSAQSWLEPLEPDMIVLDVACGAAHASEQAAPHVRKPGGRVVVNDLIAPDAAVRDAFDALHRSIDPSHVRAFLPDELAALVQTAVGPIEFGGLLEPFRFPVGHVLTQVADATAARAALLAEVDGGPQTGFEPARVGDEITVTFRTAVVSARRVGDRAA